jgi:hypothetical protein
VGEQTGHAGHVGQAAEQFGLVEQTEARPHFVVIPSRPTIRTKRRSRILLGMVTILSLWFIDAYALKYFTLDSERLGIYRYRHDWLLAHIAGGTAALLLGPVQLWLGSNRRNMTLHRFLGIGYVMSVATSSTAAFYLAWKTDFGWVFGLGLIGMGVAWCLSTLLAVVAIGLRRLDQHREWMIRSCVITFAFVIFRIVVAVLAMARIGTFTEQMTAASWLSWTVPILITESILQGRKIFSKVKN